MWIQIDNDEAKRILALKSKNASVKYLQERIRHYQDTEDDIAQRFRAAAEVREGTLEVDNDAVVSVGEDAGAYVMSWQWVTNEQAGFDSEEGSENLAL